jgi:hypothetical protein
LDAKKLKALEAEHAKLKKLEPDQMMDVSTLKKMLAKNFLGLLHGVAPWTGPLHRRDIDSGGPAL